MKQKIPPLKKGYIPSANRITRADYSRLYGIDWHLVNHWVSVGHLRKCIRDNEIWVDATQPLPKPKNGRPKSTLSQVKSRAMANVKKSIDKFKERNKK